MEALPPVPEAKGRKAGGRAKRGADPGTDAATSGAIEPAVADDVSQILAAWDQIPADVRDRLLEKGRMPSGTVAG